MNMLGSLVSLADAESWLNITSDGGGPVDAGVSRLIRAVSTAIYGFLDRQVIAAQTVNEIRDGTGTNRMILHEWPVSSIQSLVVGNQVIPAGVDPGPNANYLAPGYLFTPRLVSVPPGQPCVVSLVGYRFPQGSLNIGIDYVAGYIIENEAWTVPTGLTPTVAVLGPMGSWASDMGVSYAATGLALTAVTGTPSQGQYALGAQGQYVFNTADHGAVVMISYGYIPEAVAYSCLEGIQTLTALQTRDPALKSERYGDVAWSYNVVGSIGKMAPGSMILTSNMTSLLQPYRSLTMAA